MFSHFAEPYVFVSLHSFASLLILGWKKLQLCFLVAWRTTQRGPTHSCFCGDEVPSVETVVHDVSSSCWQEFMIHGSWGKICLVCSTPARCAWQQQHCGGGPREVAMGRVLERHCMLCEKGLHQMPICHRTLGLLSKRSCMFVSFLI